MPRSKKHRSISVTKIICVLGVLGFLAVSWVTPAQAVILYSKSDRNTSAPRGKLGNSGWQWEGHWSDFLGTAIAKSFFITAEHIGGNVGDYFSYNGKQYKSVATFDDPNSDLQIWRIHGQFDSFAPLLTDYTDVGKTAVIYGRGTQRGGEVSVNGNLRGWLWGDHDSVQSWGTNLISGSTQGLTDGDETGRKKVKGGRLYWSFDRNGLADEGALSDGDSGGGLFVYSNKKWQLAGVNYSTQATFSYPNSIVLHQAALFDAGGLGNGNGTIADADADIPALSYATRISAESKWISDVIAGRIGPSDPLAISGAGVPEPGWLSGWAIILLISARKSRQFSGESLRSNLEQIRN